MDVQVGGFEALGRKLARAERLEPVSDLVRDTVDFVEDEAEHGAKPHPGDIGKLSHGDNIRQSMSSAMTPLAGQVYTNSPIVFAVDQGRPPGRMPPIRLMSIWAVRHGIGKRRGFYLARAIGRHGSKGVGFFKKAYDAGRKKIDDRLPRVARAIEEEWGQ